MKCFELIKSVLDEIYADIPGETAAKNALISQRLRELQASYSKLATHTGDGNSVDYADPATRFAYIYAYVTSHSDMVYQRIASFANLRSVFSLDHVRVTCIGGGPGSDFIGILKFLMSRDNPVPLHCTFYDREEAWGESWLDVSEKIGREANVSTYSQRFDVTVDTTWKQNRKYLDADFFTAVYFFSEVYSKRDEAQNFFAHLFEKMKSGALFLYIDNDSPIFTQWFDELIEESGLEVLQSGTEDARLDSNEEKSALGDYLNMFGSFPKLKGRIAYRVCRKP